MQMQQLVRVFSYNGVQLPDPSPAMTPEMVKELYASTTYPELMNAAVDGPVVQGDKQVFTFIKAVRDKGGRQGRSWVEELKAIATGEGDKAEANVVDLDKVTKENEKCGDALVTLFHRKSGVAHQACMVSEALPILL